MLTAMAMIAVLAVILGIAIHRSTTCAVLAVEELMQYRRPDRFVSFFECSLWVSLCLLVLDSNVSATTERMPMGIMLAGAVIFGIGAATNEACAFGTIGRIGNGRVDFFLSFAGICAGIKAGAAIAPPTSPGAAYALPGMLWVLVLLGATMGLRLFLRRRDWRGFAANAVVMAIIGSANTLLGHLHQPWPWLNAFLPLPDLAVMTLIALICLIAGAIASGLMRGNFRLYRPNRRDLVRRLAGGFMIGTGTALIPGGNDTLVLHGIPRGDPNAILAYLVLLGTIAGVLWLTGQHKA